MAVKDKKAVIRSLIESGKANGKLTTREINDALEQLDFEVEKVDRLNGRHRPVRFGRQGF